MGSIEEEGPMTPTAKVQAFLGLHQNAGAPSALACAADETCGWTSRKTYVTMAALAKSRAKTPVGPSSWTYSVRFPRISAAASSLESKSIESSSKDAASLSTSLKLNRTTSAEEKKSFGEVAVLDALAASSESLDAQQQVPPSPNHWAAVEQLTRASRAHLMLMHARDLGVVQRADGSGSSQLTASESEMSRRESAKLAKARQHGHPVALVDHLSHVRLTSTLQRMSTASQKRLGRSCGAARGSACAAAASPDEQEYADWGTFHLPVDGDASAAVSVRRSQRSRELPREPSISPSRLISAARSSISISAAEVSVVPPGYEPKGDDVNVQARVKVE